MSSHDVSAGRRRGSGIGQLACAAVMLHLTMMLAGCGERPARTGVLVGQGQFAKQRVGDSPAGLPSRGLNLDHRDVVVGRDSEWRRVKEADLLGDEASEYLVETADRKGVAVVDKSGQELSRLPTRHYVTDFGSIVASRSPKRDVLLYEYPNEARGATFTIVSPGQTEVASWTEASPTSGLDSGTWRGEPAVFYLRGDQLVVRSAAGIEQAALQAPTGSMFASVRVRELAQGQSVLLASGSGYTPFHMVCVYDADQRLVFQEVGHEHAFDIDVAEDGKAFTVWTRSAGWRYTS